MSIGICRRKDVCRGGRFALFSIFRCGDGDGESGIHSHAARIEGGTGGGVVGVEKRNPVKTTGEGLDLPPPPIHDASYRRGVR